MVALDNYDTTISYRLWTKGSLACVIAENIDPDSTMKTLAPISSLFGKPL